MSLHSLFLAVLITLIGLFVYLILNLNSNIVRLDLLFYEFEISLGFGLISFFLLGLFITLVLEITYFLGKKGKSK